MVHEEDQVEMDQVEMELWYIITRKQQLQSRRTLLLELQGFLKNNNFREASFMRKDDQELSELEQIEQEIQILSERETELRNAKEQQSSITEITESSSATVQKPTDEELSSTTPEVVEVVDLSFSPATVQCPTCQQQVITEIQHKVGKTSFLLCYLSILLGCVGGCCLLPFFLNYFKDTCHFCPSCHTEIHTVPRI
ncbi:hypothetical protein AMELA_G00114170 [Ameiurus melas]|uniref:LITAF domain-containing protein n=1 Tax=Ameiurus melas TaxID=219545 RepID=A0A7J6ARH8_AMEME|nr:hypothetical protein AMELA_G00114170 [Ameiurus melas]